MAVDTRARGSARSRGAALARQPTGRRPRPRPELPRLRVMWLLAAAILLATAIWGRLAYWQVAQHSALAAQAQAQYQTRIPLPASRGMIFDRDGRPLALDATVYDVTLAPDFVAPSQREQVAGGLAGVLGVAPDHVMQLLESGAKFEYVARRQSKDRADQLSALKLPGVYLQAVEQRQYLPGGQQGATLASQLLGFVDWNGTGQRGVEQQYQGVLAGHAGYESTYQDLLGRTIVLGPDKRVDPANGADLQLTLDSNVQFAAEQAIAQGVKDNHAESGSVIAMDPKTGGIVAWASYPSYDANRFNVTDPTLTRDPIVSDLYEPGSIMKVATLSGAIDAGSITPATVISDPGWVQVPGATLHDWDGAVHGNVTMTKVLEDSLNVGAVKAMQAEGQPSFLHYLQAFGLGRPSGVDVAGEASIPMRPADQWKVVDAATAAYGQGIAVNMVQMVAAINVIANHGVWVQPHVVQAVGAQPGRPAAPRRVVSSQTADEMNAMMRSVVQHGSGHEARIAGFELDEAGKTGTSNIPVNGGYTQDVWASYAGFLPAVDPQLTMLVVVNRPHNPTSLENEGYFVSAPIWKRVAQDAILDWQITPESIRPV